MSTDSIVKAKSMDFAKRIVKLYKYLCKYCRSDLWQQKPSTGSNC